MNELAEKLERCERAIALMSGWLPGEVWQKACDILNPPEFEEVEVVRWAIFRNDDVRDFFDTEGSAIRCRDNHHHGAPIIKLTGTIKRPVKREVVKEVSVENVEINPNGGFRNWTER